MGKGWNCKYCTVGISSNLFKLFFTQRASIIIIASYVVLNIFVREMTCDHIIHAMINHPNVWGYISDYVNFDKASLNGNHFHHWVNTAVKCYLASIPLPLSISAKSIKNRAEIGKYDLTKYPIKSEISVHKWNVQAVHFHGNDVKCVMLILRNSDSPIT